MFIYFSKLIIIMYSYQIYILRQRLSSKMLDHPFLSPRRIYNVSQSKAVDYRDNITMTVHNARDTNME